MIIDCGLAIINSKIFQMWALRLAIVGYVSILVTGMVPIIIRMPSLKTTNSEEMMKNDKNVSSSLGGIASNFGSRINQQFGLGLKKLEETAANAMSPFKAITGEIYMGFKVAAAVVLILLSCMVLARCLLVIQSFTRNRNNDNI